MGAIQTKEKNHGTQENQQEHQAPEEVQETRSHQASDQGTVGSEYQRNSRDEIVLGAHGHSARIRTRKMGKTTASKKKAAKKLKKAKALRHTKPLTRAGDQGSIS